MHRFAMASILASIMALLLPGGTPQPYVVIVRGPADACSVEAAGRKLTIDQLLKAARAEAREGRRARILTDMNGTPYRCIGGVIYTLQMAGFDEVDFDASVKPAKR
jgi:hypothetical protein